MITALRREIRVPGADDRSMNKVLHTGVDLTLWVRLLLALVLLVVAGALAF